MANKEIKNEYIKEFKIFYQQTKDGCFRVNAPNSKTNVPFFDADEEKGNRKILEVRFRWINYNHYNLMIPNKDYILKVEPNYFEFQDITNWKTEDFLINKKGIEYQICYENNLDLTDKVEDIIEQKPKDLFKTIIENTGLKHPVISGLIVALLVSLFGLNHENKFLMDFIAGIFVRQEKPYQDEKDNTNKEVKVPKTKDNNESTVKDIDTKKSENRNNSQASFTPNKQKVENKKNDVPSSKITDTRVFSYQDESTELWGFKNQQGKVIIFPKFILVREFVEGLAAVKNKDNLWGYIDMSGKEVIKCQFETANDFYNGKADVMSTSGYQNINKKGNVID